jgi:hypothetical protein
MEAAAAAEDGHLRRRILMAPWRQLWDGTEDPDGDEVRLFFKKGFKKTKIRKRGASCENLEKWVPPAR